MRISYVADKLDELGIAYDVYEPDSGASVWLYVGIAAAVVVIAVVLVLVLLHQLPEPYKEVFSLRVFGELPFAQIGELFGKTDSWARVIFYRAKTKLRRDFDENTV